MLERNPVKLHLHGLLLLLLTAPIVRVAIIKEAKNLTIHGNELRIKIPEAHPLNTYLASPVNIEPIENGFRVGSGLYLAPSIQISSAESDLLIDGKHFEGTIELRRDAANKLLVLNELPVEEYLSGVFPGEMPMHWPREAIKAQVVAARTYALFRQKEKSKRTKSLYDLESDTSDQVYVGFEGKQKNKWLEELIQETQGEVLWYLGLYPSYFHSCCGGQTEQASHVWETRDPSQSVVDPFCKKAPDHQWNLSLSHSEFLGKLREHGLEGNQIRSVTLERYDRSPRNILVVLATEKMNLYVKATDLRRILDYDLLKSTWFDVKTTPHKIVFEGFGYGHGVGLCQWGAKTMAEAGADYKKILNFYYPKAAIRKIY